MPLLEVENLVKDFRSHWTFKPLRAVNSISFAIESGEVFGFLGHNGAGKTTTIKCILGLVRTTSGRIRYDGQELKNPAQRASIGYLSELPYFYDHLTVRETLEFLGKLYGKKYSAADFQKRIDVTIDRVGLQQKRTAFVRTLSKGLQQRLGMAQAIITQPQLLLLDEPFSGLDPIGRYEFKKLIEELRQEGTTVVLSSHVLSDVEHLCNRVLIMTKGEIRSTFSIKDIPKLFGELYELTIGETAGESELYKALEQGAHSAETSVYTGEPSRVYIYDNAAVAHQALKTTIEAGAQVREFKPRIRKLEEIFVEVTTHGK